MANKPSKINPSSWSRTASASLAGIRASGAFALDGAFRKLRPGDKTQSTDFAKREALLFVAKLGQLKGTYVKIGQMFALLGEHFLPAVLTEALHTLESQTQPLPWETIEPVLQASLGDRFAELRIEKKAIAAASLAQVHRATIIVSGEEICLKVQYPGLADVIDADFDAVVRMLLLARWVRAGRELDDWLEAMRAQLHHEIDYLREAQMTGQMAVHVQATNQARRPSSVRYHVPRCYPKYCTEDVLALEFIDGHLVTDAHVVQLSQARRSALGEAMLELFLFELYQWGVMQTDPNFGNYLIRKSCDGAGDELVLLDFGSVLCCEEGFLVHLGNAIAAGQAEDRSLLLDSLMGLGCLNSSSTNFAKDSFCDFCLQLLEPLRTPQNLPPQYLNAQGQYCWGQSKLLRRVGKNAASSAITVHFSTPTRDFAMIARKLTGVFTFIAVLNAEFNAHDLVQAHISRWLEEA
ncbi:MAG: putative unusual protein kinase regulating ubiquinone biosynthesis (AarF/ABC1/UbiB family) [Halioglobus sp.]